MATKPTIADAEFASDATFASGFQSGEAVRADPGAATRKQGFIAKMVAVPKWLNFTFYQLYLWCVYVNDLHNSTDFLDKNYSWTGLHVFDSGVTVNATLVVGGAVLGTSHIAADGDVRTMGDFEYCDTNGNHTLPVRTIAIPLTDFRSTGSSSWDLAFVDGTDEYAWSTQTPAGDFLIATVKIPTGCNVTQVQIGVSQSDAAALDKMALQLFKAVYDDGATPGQATNTQQGTTQVLSGATGAERLTLTGTFSVDRAEEELIVRVRASDSGAGVDRFFWCKIMFEDRALRNY